jgi:hypothetical protein
LDLPFTETFILTSELRSNGSPSIWNEFESEFDKRDLEKSFKRQTEHNEDTCNLARKWQKTCERNMFAIHSFVRINGSFRIIMY